MMKYLIYFTFLSLIACSDDYIGGEVIDVTTMIFLENGQGQNLFDAATPGAINRDSVQLYWLRNGVPTLAYQANLDCQSFVCKLDEGALKGVVAYLYDDTSDDPNQSAIIKWNATDSDTLKWHLDIKNDGNYVAIDEIWFNDKKMFPDNAIPGLGTAFKVIK